LADRVARLEKGNRQLQQKLKQAELIIEAQKKCRRSWESLRIWKKVKRSHDRRGWTSKSALARPSRQETYRNKPIVPEKGPQFDQSALTDVRLRSWNRLQLV
jgi:hypothetical protein